MQGFVLDKTASQIFNILTEHCLEVGDEFPPYREIIINNGRHWSDPKINCEIYAYFLLNLTLDT
jgi:hypothetical protein